MREKLVSVAGNCWYMCCK